MTAPEPPALRTGSRAVGTDELGESRLLRIRRGLYRARRAGLGPASVLILLALLAGFLVGRQTAPDPGRAVRMQLEQEVLPLVFDADGIWTAHADGEPGASVSEAMVALQRDGDASVVTASARRWLSEYDAIIGRIAAVDVAPAGRPVQRQFISGVTLSRDAVDVLARAARIEDGGRRAGLLTEAARLRLRAEQSVQSARAGILDLDGGAARVEPLPDLPEFPAPDTAD